MNTLNGIKVMLVNPRFTVHKNDVRRCVIPLGVAYLASFLEQYGCIVKILDVSAEGYYNTRIQDNFVTYGLSDIDIIKSINKFSPDVVGVSCIFSAQSKNVKDILKLVKNVNKDIITITGGSHPTYAVEEMMNCKYLDYIVMGEGELPTLQLLNTLNNGENVSKIGGIAHKENNKICINNNLQYIENLDTIPFPAWDLLNMENYFKINMPHNPYSISKRVVPIVTSRGCPAKCTFCTSTNFWGRRYRERSPQNVISEIKELIDKYRVEEIQFTDDNFTLNKKRSLSILEGLERLGLVWCAPNGIAVWTLDDELLEEMKKTGCHQLTFAIESGNQYVLSKIIKKPLNLKKVKPLVKKAHELGIKVHAFCICGMPGETIRQMHETYDFVKDCEFDSSSFFAATPLVGSELMKICKENRYIEKDFVENELLFKVGNISTDDFDAEEIYELVKNFNYTYNKNDCRKKKIEEDSKRS